MSTFLPIYYVPCLSLVNLSIKLFIEIAIILLGLKIIHVLITTDTTCIAVIIVYSRQFRICTIFVLHRFCSQLPFRDIIVFGVFTRPLANDLILFTLLACLNRGFDWIFFSVVTLKRAWGSKLGTFININNLKSIWTDRHLLCGISRQPSFTQSCCFALIFFVQAHNLLIFQL